MTPRHAGDATILVIEDDAATRDVLQQLLTLEGFAVALAATAAAGIDRAGDGSVSLIVLDRRLPDGDGLMISRHVREQLDSKVPILLLTADHDPAVDGAAQAAGVTALLRKPFDPDALLARVTSLIDRRTVPPA